MCCRAIWRYNIRVPHQWLYLQEWRNDDVGGQAVSYQADIPEPPGPVCKSTFPHSVQQDLCTLFIMITKNQYV